MQFTTFTLMLLKVPIMLMYSDIRLRLSPSSGSTLEAVEESLIDPALVIGEHVGITYVEHQRSPMTMAALPRIAIAATGIAAADLRRPRYRAMACATRSANARQLVSPGDSMPNKLTSPGTPCVCGSLMMKSAAGSVGPVIFGRIPL